MSRNDNELDFDKFISYDEETNIGQCLVPECHTVFVGKRKIAITRHYRITHEVNIEEDEKIDTSVQLNNINRSSEIEEANHHPPHMLCNIKYLQDKAGTDTLEDKGYRTFLVADYVDYNKETNTSKCLIKNCERPMSGRRTGNIKRHYHKVHNFVIVHDTQETICATSRELMEYYNNETFGDSSRPEEENEEDMSDAEEQQPVNLDQYIDYDPLINKSQCKVPGCKAYLVGKKPFSIQRHYGLVHNYDIESNGTKLVDKSKYSLMSTNGQVLNSSIIQTDDLLAYDIESSTFQCLFINCNHMLEKHLPSIKQHYHEKHRIIIARDSCNIPHRFYRKRKQRDVRDHYQNGSEFWAENLDETEEPSSCFIKNELLSDDEHQSAHCSKRSKNNLTDFMKERQSSSTCAIKKENLSEDNQLQPYNHSLREKSSPLQINFTKHTFFKLCLGLVIERDLCTQLFDDDTYFKPLLAPYEQIFDCVINAGVIEQLMHKANNIIVQDLKETFKDKIVCLELLVLSYENNYYVVVNVRFLERELAYNKVIGVLPVNEKTKNLPIAECLSKFNIAEQQVYMKTIMAGLHDDNKIYEICENLCKHNADLKNHPIYDLQKILRSFVHEYSEDVQMWSIVSHDYKQTLKYNFQELELYINNSAETDIGFKHHEREAKCFLKAWQIYWNFMEKLAGEQYVAGDFYRDCLCCELELKAELTKTDYTYAGYLYEELSKFKSRLMERREFVAALYLDARFNFLGSGLLSEEQKGEGKLFLCTLWEKYNNYLNSTNSSCADLVPLEDANDDEYALLTQHINDTMPLKSSISLQDKLTNCIATKREPFSLDILKYWQSKRSDWTEVAELNSIALTFSATKYMLRYLQGNFYVPLRDIEKFDKFVIKFNQSILYENTQEIFENI